MKFRGILLLMLILTAMAFSDVFAQETGGFVLKSNPAGATAYLKGDFELIVMTPANLPANLSGIYKARIVRPGYEQWKGDLTFLPGSASSFNIDLKEKTRFKAGVRSIFFPGWGQIYSGNSLRGGLFTLSTIVTVAGLYTIDKEYQDRRAEYDIAAQAYSDALSIDERVRLKTIKDAKQRRAYSTETDRRTIFYIAVGLWAYNIFDSVIFFPEGKAYYPSISALDGGAMLTCTVRF